MPAPPNLPHRAATTDGLGASSENTSDASSGDLPFVPPSHPARTLVLCFDGTGDQFDDDNSNVVKFFSLLKKDDRNEQMVYYQTGIGTYSSPQASATPLRSKVDKLLDSMIAWNLDAHVQSGYEFLMQNYQAGDKICLFGFSRGAYTARALAGMVHKVGLLPACNHEQIPFAYRMYTRTDDPGWKQATEFKEAFSIEVNIDFIGVWDTVASVGLIPQTLPFTTSNCSIRVFRHAVALDERRARFQANLYQHPTEEELKRGTHPGDMPQADIEYATAVAVREPKGKKKPKSDSQRQYQQLFNTTDDCGHKGTTDVLEVWFAGCHCDVGGGSVGNKVPHTLARIPLRWMVRECFKTNTGIRFHGKSLRAIGIDPATLHPRVADRPPPLVPHSSYLVGAALKAPLSTEEEHEVRDALSPKYDQLDLAWYKWVSMEYLPMLQPAQGPPEAKKRVMNRGNGRLVPERGEPFFVHRSVKLRMEAKGLPGGPYAPMARYVREPTWVD